MARSYAQARMKKKKKGVAGESQSVVSKDASSAGVVEKPWDGKKKKKKSKKKAGDPAAAEGGAELSDVVAPSAVTREPNGVQSIDVQDLSSGAVVSKKKKKKGKKKKKTSDAVATTPTGTNDVSASEPSAISEMTT